MVGILSQSMNAVFWPKDSVGEESTEDSDARYAPFAQAFEECDIVLVEGDTRTNAPKIEVWRAVNDTPPIADRVANVCAIITDDPIENTTLILSRQNLAAIADYVCEL